MELHRLKPAIRSLNRKKRVGRGQGSGKGGTSTRGHNGAQSRSGYKIKMGFEGGQTPMHRRVPKHGFKSPKKIHFIPLNLSVLQELVDKHQVDKIDPLFLRQHRIIGKYGRYKVLGDGTLTTKISVCAHGCSKSALQAIQELGGSVTILSLYE